MGFFSEINESSREIQKHIGKYICVKLLRTGKRIDA
jgi:hypothetical protein